MIKRKIYVIFFKHRYVVFLEKIKFMCESNEIGKIRILYYTNNIIRITSNYTKLVVTRRLVYK